MEFVGQPGARAGEIVHCPECGGEIRLPDEDPWVVNDSDRQGLVLAPPAYLEQARCPHCDIDVDVTVNPPKRGRGIDGMTPYDGD